MKLCSETSTTKRRIKVTDFSGWSHQCTVHWYLPVCFFLNFLTVFLSFLDVLYKVTLVEHFNFYFRLVFSTFHVRILVIWIPAFYSIHGLVVQCGSWLIKFVALFWSSCLPGLWRSFRARRCRRITHSKISCLFSEEQAAVLETVVLQF